MQSLDTCSDRKFTHPKITAKGEPRAFVEAKDFNTIWFNTGTQCNLECKNCYIESSPKNDRLVYLTVADVEEYLDEIQSENYSVNEIAFTGGEPFMNKNIIEILNLCLLRGFETLILTNAMLPMQKKTEELLGLKKIYGNKIKMRVSLDHFSQERHEEERGLKSWMPAVKGLKWLSENNFSLSIAGRTLWGEKESTLREGFSHFFNEHNIKLDANNPSALLLFPEMDESVEVPEITTSCWGILNKAPEEIMCSNSRMVVRRKGDRRPKVLACTLLAYEPEFELGDTLKQSQKSVYLNHPHCAKFCVLGGASCSK